MQPTTPPQPRPRPNLCGPLVLLTVALTLALRPGPAAALNDDEIRGYTAAVLEREFNVKPEAVTVRDGVVRIQADLPDSDREKLSEALKKVDGVQQVEFTQVTAEDTRPVGFEWLPLHSQFKPLLADPRWPHFAAAYQYYIDDDLLDSVGSADLGETFALVRYSFDGGGSVELAIQGGVFAIFDLSAESKDLVNADYLGAIPLSYANGNFSLMARFLHQSSHLGDEFLLSHSITRVNLSYERFDLIGSYELSPEVRIYGGPRYLFDQEPSNLKPWSIEYGAEYVRDTALPLSFELKPLVALDLQNNEQGDWTTNLSLRGGVEFGKPLGIGRNIQLLLEFYRGKSVNGQFYDQNVAYVGIGAHLYF